MESPNSFWSKLGVWVWMPERFDPHAFGMMLRDAGFRWVTVQTHNGLGVRPETKQALDAGWATKLSNTGIQVGSWGVLIDHPEREANLATQLAYRWHMAHYIADAEGPHKGDWKMDDGTMGDQRRSDTFVKHFRRLRPAFPLGFTTFGAAPDPFVLGHTQNDDAGPMHFRCWAMAGARFIPQAYPNEFGPVYEPLACVQHAKRSHWPLSLTHMAIGVYAGWTGRDYIERMRQARAISNNVIRGFSVYSAETVTDNDYQVIGDAAKKYGLATL
jgi:hypothetical protein